MPQHRRSRSGCQTCKNAGRKCDERKPQCSRCIRLEKDCSGYDVVYKWQMVQPQQAGGLSNQRGRRVSPKTPASLKPQHSRELALSQAILPRAMSSGVEPQYAYLLDHWNTTLASLITMAPTAQNQFHVNLTPMIPHSQSLCSAICYMAACHLYVLKGGASLRNIVDQCQGDTIKSLRPLIGLSQHSDLDKQSYQTSLATIMVLQITEALFLVRTGAEHLKGAKAIIEKGHELRTWDCDIGIFLLNICCYYDAISSVARRCPPIIDTNPYVPFLKGMQPIGDLKTLWAIIGRISGMGCQSGDTLDRHGKAIEATLQELDEHANREGDAGHTIHAYIAAAYIYLYRRWHGVGSPHPTTLRHAENCLNHLFKIPVESPLVASHVWPLFTAACETIDVQLRDGVRERLEAMYELRHLPSLQSTLNDIETAWEKKDEERARTGSDGLDCVCIIHHMKKRDPDLL